jgi:RNA polymerase sigma factor (sigma-70 family)
MEDRNYTFYDRFQKVRYTNVTKEELEVLNHYYAKDYYMMKLQYAQMKISTFTDLGSDNTEISEFLADPHAAVEQESTSRLMLQRMMTDLTEKERTVIEDMVMGGFTSSEIAEKLHVSSRQISRYKKSALEKLLVKMKEAGYDNFDEAATDFLL